jgi:hypothetical protein
METLIVQSKNKEDLRLIASLLNRMKIQAKFLSKEEREDFGLIMLMKQADRSKKVPYEKVMEKLAENES